ncbi:uncharacterized protein BN707_02268 [Bacteroides fragilis CAG:558]|nr:uncharacterized protein BN707_02268 [Bacteroides fragilis CAG:558]
MKQCRAEFFYGIRRPLSGFAILVAMTMLAQHPVRQCAVSQQLDRAVEVPFQPFGVDACSRVIVQCFVHAGDVLYLLQHRPDVMADEDDGAVAVDLRLLCVLCGEFRHTLQFCIMRIQHYLRLVYYSIYVLYTELHTVRRQNDLFPIFS